LKLGTSEWRSAAALPIPRDHVTAIALNGKLYAFGGEIGHDAHHRQQTRSDVYDPSTDSWTRIADMPMSKSHSEPSAFASDGRIIIAGGQIDNYAATNTILQYDPATNSWSLLGNLPGALQGTMLQRIGNRLILTNGYDGTHMRTATWTAPWPTLSN
jgi:N-acetylneuraminic acid mutarotase